MLLGLPAKGCCLHQALVSWVELKVFLCYPGWELRLGLTSHPSEATLRKPDFLLRCRRLPFTGWESSPGLCSSVPLVASADAGFVDLCTPEPGLRAELEKRGKWVP